MMSWYIGVINSLMGTMGGGVLLGGVIGADIVAGDLFVGCEV